MSNILPAPFPSGVYSLRFYQKVTATTNFVDNQWLFVHPKDGTTQAWSKGIRIISATGGYAEFTFDGTNVHGRVDNGEIAEYWDRYEGGVAVRGSGTIKVEAW